MPIKFQQLIPLLFLLVSSCAVTYQDSDGNQKIVGFVSLTLEKPADQTLVAGDKVKITNVGVMYSDTPIHNGISIGYYSETTTILKNDVAVIIKNEE
ncbi:MULTISPECIES: hypothetical protein [unclassified Colwellia]|jgi:hypothetical protein|uniref:hypothetical protein n=1 Tax=unclassified Colwellia TaxID=196834 RepID=UPI0015F6A655|nr:MULTISPECIES: hypothetical protein [unclassified Colwellia]MBA6232363.1 hypothetical protein [Colwellia sp. MB02u-7]MBA6236039.1 hypothetical protein [Colwellia sp. MB02u-11]MBA6256707.1 hypothetical protein [Colwellia sp. MB3u-28]MBA6261422.1 hypothetical protein [Colwellia sp. MB3u-41]MBA6298556.1 hypothetical protein [Colwellia sp. MB3u-22]